MAVFHGLSEPISLLLQKMSQHTPTSSPSIPALATFEHILTVAKETSPDAEGSRWRVLVNHADQTILFYLLDTSTSSPPKILRSIRIQPAPVDTVYPGTRLIAHVFLGPEDALVEVLGSIPFENPIRYMGDLMRILDLMGVYGNRGNWGIVEACGAEFVRGFEGVEEKEEEGEAEVAGNEGEGEKEGSPEIAAPLAVESQPAPTRIDTIVASDRPFSRTSPSPDSDSGIGSGNASPIESSSPAEKSDTRSFSFAGLSMFCLGPLRKIVEELVAAIRNRDRAGSFFKRKRFYSNPEMDKVLCELEYELLKRGRGGKEKKELMRRLAAFAGCTVCVLTHHMKNACERAAKELIAAGKQ